MSNLFKDMLKEGESLFRDTIALDYDYLPKVLPYREKEQRQFAFAIKPLLQERNGRNLFVYGAPGIGKTAACKHVLRELEDETDAVVPVYINCWKHNTAYKILLEMSERLGIRFTANLKTSELFARIKEVANKKSVVFVFDEIDKLEDFDVLYMLLEDVYRKAVFLITNYKEKVSELDERIMSRLNPEMVEFKPYNKEETRGILEHRRKYAFVPGIWDEEAFSMIVDKTAAHGDLRKGLFLMREAGNLAEENASRKIEREYVQKAIERQFVANEEKPDDDAQRILGLVQQNPGEKMGPLFQKFLSQGSEMSYKSFQRKIEKLEKGKKVATEKVSGGREGNTSVVYPYDQPKKLTEY
ncbi:MAG TPA: AAA family ATPase [Candidatus Nanoarchaeia archaeon]|nr:AAA family ATPase [Candidatus Nanoarchaeia archaeon]